MSRLTSCEKGKRRKYLEPLLPLEGPRIEEEGPLPQPKEEVAEADCLLPLNQEGFT